jgi:uncharacterized protein (UPF0212 family)
MQSLSASDLLEIWERGAGLAPQAQALAILGFVFPQASPMQLALLTIGQRDACLLKLRELTFGSRLAGIAACPACGERVETAFAVDDFPISAYALPDPGSGEFAHAETSIHLPPYDLLFRLPTGADLELLTNPSTAQEQLMQACLLSASKDGQPVSSRDLPVEVLDAVMESMSQADPLANITVALTCPACGHQWQVIFDIVSHFWSEIHAWAARLMREVHVLASAYGWREADILSMSAWRRQRYLELIRSE